MKGLPRNERRRDAVDPTPTPPPVAIALGPRPAGPREAATSDPGAARDRKSSSDPRRSAPSRAALIRASSWLLLFVAVATTVALLVSRALAGMPPVAVATWRTLLSYGHALAGARLATSRPPHPEALFAAPEAAAPPAKIRHEGYASIRGGVLFTPDTFAPRGGVYDLLVHFHGNTQVVRESAEVAGLDAAVAVINLGIGSGPYEEAYAVPGTYEALLEEIEDALVQRGVERPHLRRVALSSWSAGYGSISKILDVRRGTDPLDAILVLDGIHTGWIGGARDPAAPASLFASPGALNTLPLAPFARAVKQAAAGSLLFTITHSEIDPITYVGTSLTADYLLEIAAGAAVKRTPAAAAPPHLALRSAEGAVAKRLEKRMIPTTEARIGQLHVRGYRGNTPEHHMAHLLQMAATVLPDLADRWRAR
ncbi:MAG: hypothetical protein IT372_03800 [Polyangiaceae bacterium]|nr:hypothetical protein [Polyangiaceae bacterium]